MCNSDYCDSNTMFVTQLKECDTRLLSISVPDEVSRVPKTLNDFMHRKGIR